MLKDDWIRKELGAHPFPLLFVTVGGDHLYGFASSGSGWALRGVHLLPLAQVVGLKKGPETVSRSGDRDGTEMDMASQELQKFIRLMLKHNGFVLEQLFSPLVLQTSAEHKELVALGKGCVTRHHVHHYLGLAENLWKNFSKDSTHEVKPLLLVFRVLLTGIHLLRTGEVESNLVTLNQQFRMGFLEDLVSFMREGKEKGGPEEPRLDLVEKEYRRLLGALEIEGERTSLPEEPTSIQGLHDLLVRVRLSQER